MTNIFHILVNETLSQVLESQVIRPASRFADRAEVQIFGVTPVGLLLRSPWKTIIKELKRHALSNYGIKLNTIAGMPSRLSKCRLDRLLTCFVVRKNAKEKHCILHARGPFASELALLIQEKSVNCKVVFDCRADDPAEAVGRLGFDPDDRLSWSEAASRTFDTLIALERKVVERVDAVVCVSERLRDLIVQRHAISPSRCQVIPCCVDIERFREVESGAARKRLGLQGRFVVCYLGSVEWYQLPKESLRIFKAIRDLQPNAHLLVLTTNIDRMNGYIAESGIDSENVTIMKVPADEVPKILPAAHLGLLLRRADAVNRVASPIKFAEYLAAGVSLITTPGIGDYSEVVEKERLGKVVHIDANSQFRDRDIQDLVSILNDESSSFRCQDYAARKLSLDTAEERQSDLYESLGARF